MKEKKSPQLQRAEKLVILASEILQLADHIKLNSEGYGNGEVCVIKINEIEDKTKELLFALKNIKLVVKNGEDHQSVISC